MVSLSPSRMSAINLPGFASQLDYSCVPVSPWSSSIPVPHLQRRGGKRTTSLHPFFPKFIPSICKAGAPRRKHASEVCRKAVRTHSPGLAGHPGKGYPSFCLLWVHKSLRGAQKQEWRPIDTCCFWGEGLQGTVYHPSQQGQFVVPTALVSCEWECCLLLPGNNPESRHQPNTRR